MTFLRPIPALSMLMLLLSAGGCTYVNQPLNSLDAPIQQRRLNHTHAAMHQSSDLQGPTPRPAASTDDGWFVGLAISGGGSRSANFSAGVMLELQRLGLLQKVDA